MNIYPIPPLKEKKNHLFFVHIKQVFRVCERRVSGRRFFHTHKTCVLYIVFQKGH